jgi:hypothetical protein
LSRAPTGFTGMARTEFVERRFVEDGVRHVPHSKESLYEMHSPTSTTSSR